jgi:hypothetical protein
MPLCDDQFNRIIQQLIQRWRIIQNLFRERKRQAMPSHDASLITRNGATPLGQLRIFGAVLVHECRGANAPLKCGHHAVRLYLALFPQSTEGMTYLERMRTPAMRSARPAAV